MQTFSRITELMTIYAVSIDHSSKRYTLKSKLTIAYSFRMRNSKLIKFGGFLFTLLLLFQPSVAHSASAKTPVEGAECFAETVLEKVNLYCYLSSGSPEVLIYENTSNQIITINSPVSRTKGESGIHRTNLAKDISIVGIAKENIRPGALGQVWAGGGDPDISEHDSNIIPNFDTSSYKKGALLYVSESGGITDTRPSKAIIVGRVFWPARAESDSYTLEIAGSNSGIWKKLPSTEGQLCGDLPEFAILPQFRCDMNEDGNYVLFELNQGSTLAESIQESTGFVLDWTSGGLILCALLLFGIFYSVFKEGSSSKKKAFFQSSVTLLFAALTIFGLVALYINVLEPLFSGTKVDFSKKIFGVPQYVLFMFWALVGSGYINNKRK